MQFRPPWYRTRDCVARSAPRDVPGGWGGAIPSKRRFTDYPGRVGEADFPRHVESQSLVLRRRGSARGRAVRPLARGLALASIVAHVLADLPTDTGLRLLLPFSRRRLSLNLWKNTGYWGARCTSATTGSRGRGSSRARCSPWWLGATRGSWHETRHVRALALLVHGPCRRSCRRRFEATLLYYARLYPAWLLALVGHAQRVGGGRRQLPAGGLRQRGSRSWRGLRTGPGCAGASRPFSAPRSGPLRS